MRNYKKCDEVDALSACGVALLERLVVESDTLDLGFLLLYHSDWELDFLIPFTSDSN